MTKVSDIYYKSQAKVTTHRSQGQVAIEQPRESFVQSANPNQSNRSSAVTPKLPVCGNRGLKNSFDNI